MLNIDRIMVVCSHMDLHVYLIHTHKLISLIKIRFNIIWIQIATFELSVTLSGIMLHLQLHI